MKCPKCGDEYREGFDTCADCGIALVPDDYVAPAKEQANELEEELEAPSIPVMDAILEHLVALGFQITPQEGTFQASHPKVSTVYVSEYEGGAIFELLFEPNKKAKETPADYLTFINHFNNEVPVLRALHHETENRLILDAWFGGEYSRERFEKFIQIVFAELNTFKMLEQFHEYFS